MFMEALLTSTVVVALAEVGDKTQLLAIVLATRFKRPLHGALDEVGFEEVDSAEIIASLTRHLMAGFHDRNEASVAAEAENWLARLPREDRERFCLAANGDLLVFQGEVPEPVERRKLVLALATPDRQSVV